MDVHITYKQASLHEAARFIWERNPAVRHWPSGPQSPVDVLDNIHQLMSKQALANAGTLIKEKKLTLDYSMWCDYTGTGGYYLIFSLESEPTSADDNIVIHVEILVDPGVLHYDKAFDTEFVARLD